MKFKLHPISLIALLIFSFVVALTNRIILQSIFIFFVSCLSLFISKRRAFWKTMLTFGLPVTALLLILNDILVPLLTGAHRGEGIHYALRFLALLTCLLIIFQTTTPTEFARGLRPLRLPPRFNYIFLLSFEVFDTFRSIAGNVSTAQQLRGFQIRRNIFARFRNLFPLFFPVIFSALSMSLDRGIAFDFKGIDTSVSKTYLSEWKPTAMDVVYTFLFLSGSLLVLAL